MASSAFSNVYLLIFTSEWTISRKRVGFSNVFDHIFASFVVFWSFTDFELLFGFSVALKLLI